jgi:large subunit ribosomal protein L25
MKINALVRNETGKGASRRIRHLKQIPGVVYGVGEKPKNVTLNVNEITHLLENEDAYTSVLDLVIDKKKEPVIIKDLQRHPIKNRIIHVDLLRINLKQTIVTNVPIHFVGEEKNSDLRTGAVLNKIVVSIEISCLPADLPHSIDVDISELKIGDHISLANIVAPKGVTITALTHGETDYQEQSIVTIQEAKKIEEEEEETEATEEPTDEKEDKEPQN